MLETDLYGLAEEEIAVVEGKNEIIPQ